MKVLDVQARLEYARAAVAVLRALKVADRTIRYKEFATAIGLMSDRDQWQPWHRQQTRDILNLVAAVQHQAGQHVDIDQLEFERVVKEDGQPGDGYYKTSHIVTTAASKQEAPVS